jgi:hypothetical protein
MSNLDETNTRFSLIELDLPEGETIYEAPSKPEPVAEPSLEEQEAELIAKRADSGYFGPGVSKLGAERAKADEIAATEAGFSVAAPIYEIGSLVNEWGVDNFKASREEFEAMPKAHEACEKLVAQVATEQRRDIKVPLSELRMLDNGQLTRGTGGGMPVTERAISGIGNHITPGGAGYLKRCPAELRATNVNHWCESNALKEDGRATNKLMRAWERNGCQGAQPAPVMVPREVNLRTRINGTTKARESFAIVSPGYAAHDIDAIADQVMTSDAIPADARADITYDGYKARIDVLFHSNVQPERLVAGEMFKAGIMLKTSDDGTGSIQIAAQVWRNLCLNLIIIDHAKEMVTRRSHRGDGLAEAVEIGIADAMKKVEHFAEKWSTATVENVVEKYGMGDMEALFRGLVFNKVVSASGVKPAEMMDRLRNAYEAELSLAPDQRYCRSMVVNTVTRAAHENTWSKWESVEELETTGGQLLYQPVWNVIIPEKVDIAALGY